MEQFISKDDNSGYKYNKQLIGHPTNVSDTEQWSDVVCTILVKILQEP